MTQIVRYCRDCGEERPFEQHHAGLGICPDSPDGECPEWACATCGAAILIGVIPLPVAVSAAVAVSAVSADAEPHRRVA